ncbi:MAG TPA: NifB/NifX family molybdenum-iron cluster-binding protein [Spirochaetota bacterium]|nr:NifB/NifX family molybdenum-iron cluster-binding protein [Spirochaetota bacterium]HPI89349.1 NifB/NifX family molybdenum-iron cluster-binding protein [Spirochaetota bacterium]HPR48306.1 NifB/NifX family molybdenum-iron cluster-binding protein [Spirochaetota bacterium]
MKIALPVAQGKLCMHFGHCETFVIFDIDEKEKKVLSSSNLEAPPHQPGLLPPWLAEKGVTCVIAGGMGSRAVGLFNQQGVSVITGAPAGDPAEIVQQFLKGSLVTGTNVCDH